MACYRPLTAYQNASGAVFFSERQQGGDLVRELSLPCGRCIGCRLERSRQWAMRCVHEAQLHERNCFVTLTYNDSNLPDGGTLVYRHWALFMKRLRKRLGPCRFYMCGEYGEKHNRPHYHGLLFGVSFPDAVYYKTTRSGYKLYRSAVLSSLWPLGFSNFGSLTFDSAAYTARYVMKKVTGPSAVEHYRYVDPDTGEVFQRRAEFNKMSLRPGVGAGWLQKYQGDVYPRGYVVMRGQKMQPPKYYDRKFADLEPGEFERIQLQREAEGLARRADSTHERLKVRERVAAARLSLFKREVE